jgi:hypothetical protein
MGMLRKLEAVDGAKGWNTSYRSGL